MFQTFFFFKSCSVVKSTFLYWTLWLVMHSNNFCCILFSFIKKFWLNPLHWFMGHKLQFEKYCLPGTFVCLQLVSSYRMLQGNKGDSKDMDWCGGRVVPTRCNWLLHLLKYNAAYLVFCTIILTFDILFCLIIGWEISMFPNFLYPLLCLKNMRGIVPFSWLIPTT